jgi:hypothetical protein
MQRAPKPFGARVGTEARPIDALRFTLDLQDGKRSAPLDDTG